MFYDGWNNIPHYTQNLKKTYTQIINLYPKIKKTLLLTLSDLKWLKKGFNAEKNDKGINRPTG